MVFPTDKGVNDIASVLEFLIDSVLASASVHCSELLWVKPYKMYSCINFNLLLSEAINLKNAETFTEPRIIFELCTDKYRLNFAIVT